VLSGVYNDDSRKYRAYKGDYGNGYYYGDGSGARTAHFNLFKIVEITMRDAHD
jgi:hypothetical protein